MPFHLLVSLLCLIVLSSAPTTSAVTRPQPSGTAAATLSQARPTAPAEPKAPPAPEAPARVSALEADPIVRSHELRLSGRLLRYKTTTGMMPIRNAAGEAEGHIFYMAYTLEGSNPVRRPLMFSFNGGPGSSSVWLHLGALGPRRVKMQPEGWYPQPPFEMVDNQDTWLDFTDIVFIDPVGTGYSRAATPDLGKKFWSRTGDVASVGEFIRLYLTRNERWRSPLYLVGESYGTTRAAGLAGHLVDRGIAFNGIILVSTVLNFQTLDFSAGNDIGFALYVPTYAATAWFHKKLPADLQQLPLREVLNQAERWADTEYAAALHKGASLSGPEREKAVAGLARFTGLDPRVVELADLRIALPRFNHELLRAAKQTVGRLDSRFTGSSSLTAMDRPDFSVGPGGPPGGDFDPSMSAIRPPYTAMLYDYVRNDLGYRSDAEYYILGGGLGGWDMNTEGRYPNVSDDLRAAFVQNPYMKVLVAAGYYDAATPYHAARYTVDHLGLDPALRGNVSFTTYEAGHMMYIDDASRLKLRRDVEQFLKEGSSGGLAIDK